MFNFYSDQAMEKQTVKLRAVSSRYECDKRLWAAAIDDLERKIKVKYLVQDQENLLYKLVPT